MNRLRRLLFHSATLGIACAILLSLFVLFALNYKSSHDLHFRIDRHTAELHPIDPGFHIPSTQPTTAFPLRPTTATLNASMPIRHPLFVNATFTVRYRFLPELTPKDLGIVSNPQQFLSAHILPALHLALQTVHPATLFQPGDIQKLRHDALRFAARHIGDKPFLLLDVLPLELGISNQPLHAHP